MQRWLRSTPHPEMAAMRRTASALAACLASAVASVGPVVPSPYVTLSPTVVMPSLNLGTCCGSSPDVGLAPWLAAGGVGIDTAYGYRDQDNISRGLATLKVSRPDVFILSKIDPNTTMVSFSSPHPHPCWLPTADPGRSAPSVPGRSRGRAGRCEGQQRAAPDRLHRHHAHTLALQGRHARRCPGPNQRVRFPLPTS